MHTRAEIPDIVSGRTLLILTIIALALILMNDAGLMPIQSQTRWVCPWWGCY